MIGIKICGLKRDIDIAYVNRALPDYCGFIIDVPKSSRNVTPNEVRRLVAQLSPQVVPVGVFVDAPAATICQLAKENIIRMIQLHGTESEDMIRFLKQETGKPIIKVFSVTKADDIKRAEESQADYILLDHGKGGTGKSFDWSLLEHTSRPYFLAGGLKVESVEQACKLPNLFALDISSGVETDGVKDETKMVQVVTKIRMRGKDEE